VVPSVADDEGYILASGDSTQGQARDAIAAAAQS